MASRKPKPDHYLVVGSFTVAGAAPGSTVTLSDLGDANIPALIESGHLTPAAKPAEPKEQ